MISLKGRLKAIMECSPSGERDSGSLSFPGNQDAVDKRFLVKLKLDTPAGPFPT